MTPDIIELQEFYLSAQGRMVSAVLVKKLEEFWPAMRGETMAALGYPVPFLGPWTGQGGSVSVLMPETQGVTCWPPEGPNCACMGMLESLPFADESVNRVLMIHALEAASSPEEVLEEVWRILKPQGRVLVVVPNRHGLWARNEKTPFGTGRPYSAGQLRNLMKSQRFIVNRNHYALALPAWDTPWGIRLAPYLEDLGALGIGGVVVMEAIKQVYAPCFTRKKAARKRLILPLPIPGSPVPTARGSLAFERNSCNLFRPDL